MNSPSAAAQVSSRRWTLPSVGPSLFQVLAPNATLLHRIAASIVCIAAIIVCAKLRFFLPENPTPVTLQTFGVLLTGSIMGWRWGAAAIIGYLVIGGLGLQAFANQSFGYSSPAIGWQYVTGVTGGYLIGFVLASAIVGYLSQIGWKRANSLWATVAGGLILYVPALIWLAVIDFGWPADGKLLMDGMYIYLPGDLFKILAASIITVGIWNWADRRNATRRNATNS